MTEPVVDGHGWVRVRIDTQPDADGWCFCTPANHPDDVKRLGFPEWNETSQFHGKVENARRSSPDGEMVERATKAVEYGLDTWGEFAHEAIAREVLAALEAKP